MKTPNILDCTLRDGGYHNNWDFSDAFINHYLNTVEQLNINIVELGYRDINTVNTKGRFANCSNTFIEQLPLPDNLDYCIMIDAKSLYRHKNPSPTLLQDLIGQAQDSKVSVIRLAVNYKEVDQAIPIIRTIRDLGYRVFINLMQVTTEDLSRLDEKCQSLAALDLVDVIYFADSFGRMTPLDIAQVVKTMRLSWNKDIGFHGHNNKGLALMNTIEAVEEGISWVDCTINGMGRGAGNVSTEEVLREFLPNNPTANLALDELIRQHFDALMSQYKWGPNLYYYIAAEKNIHPMYVQELLKKFGKNKNDILAALTLLSTTNATHYNKETLTSFSTFKDVEHA